jgi:putative ABC transport system ATP-binding protein
MLRRWWKRRLPGETATADAALDLVGRQVQNRGATANAMAGRPLIDLRAIFKEYQSAAGAFRALKGVSVQVEAGEFVAVIGKSGSGKSTLINIVTGIDRPTLGEVYVAGTPVHALAERQIAPWRGRTLGVVFQLLPTLTLVENVMLTMDFCGMYHPSERRKRALELLGLVGMADQADRLPSVVSGGQQQRAAIASALANDPPILVADDPTGNLNSRTTGAVFELFEALVAGGKTVLMVTHDNDLARRAMRTIIVADGEVLNQWVTTALATLDLEQVTIAAAKLETLRYQPGSVVIHQADESDRFYIVTSGSAEVVLEHPECQNIVVAQLRSGQYFGEVALLRGGRRTTPVRAATDNPSELEVMALDKATFRDLTTVSGLTRESIDHAIQGRTPSSPSGCMASAASSSPYVDCLPMTSSTAFTPPSTVTMNPYSPFPSKPLDLAVGRALMPRASDRRHEAEPPTFEQARNPRQKARAAGLHPDYWYAVEYDRVLRPGQVKEVSFWDRSIALYRDHGGRPHALEDRCAHRQLELSLGEVVG